MASPRNTERRESMYDWAGTQVRALVRQIASPDAVILDVGAGWGKYRDLLPEFTMDACEIWQANVEREHLTDRYRRVFVQDIADLAPTLGINEYDVAILGDVFEHLDRETAKRTLDHLGLAAREVIVVVPYLYPQGLVGGNPYEAHLQDDLTPELMESEFPSLALRATDGSKGLYSKRGAA